MTVPGPSGGRTAGINRSGREGTEDVQGDRAAPTPRSCTRATSTTDLEAHEQTRADGKHGNNYRDEARSVNVAGHCSVCGLPRFVRLRHQSTSTATQRAHACSCAQRQERRLHSQPVRPKWRAGCPAYACGGAHRPRQPARRAARSPPRQTHAAAPAGAGAPWLRRPRESRGSSACTP